MNSANQDERSSEQKSYAQILKSSSIMGGSQVINMVFGFIRTKLVAVLIGPNGVGMLGLFQSVTGFASHLAGMGVQSSGVRDVAAAIGQGDFERFGKVILTLRRVCWITGAIGFLILWLFATPISVATFQTSDHAWSIRWLGLTILLGNIAAGQSAVIQGTRRIADLAKIGIYGSLGSTCIAAVWYGLLGIEGIVPALLSISIVTLAISTWFARNVEVPRIELSWRESLAIATGLLSLGAAFAWNGILMAGVDYGVKRVITENLGIDSVGVYVAAFSISGLVVQFVLRALKADYYPRLTAVAEDHGQMSSLMNQQTEIGIMLALPGLVFTIGCAPLMVQLLYSKAFHEAGDLLIWIVLGCFLRVLSWPLSFTMLAKSKGALFVIVETCFQASHLALVFVLVQWVGLIGAAVAFPILYTLYWLAMILVCKWLTGFRYEGRTVVVLMTSMLAIVLSLVIAGFENSVLKNSVAIAFTAAVLFLCMRDLVNKVGDEHRIAKYLKRVPGFS